MVLLSKFKTIPTSCVEYVHPWTQSCTNATTCLSAACLQESLRIYVTVYILALIMRGKIPSRQDVKKTLLAILQSTLFLTCNGTAFPLFICFLRNILGNFNVLTVSFIPAALASYVAILLERPSRRGLLSLYVTNVASETLFRMATWRGLVRPVPHGEVAIFAVSVATLLYCYRSRHASRDSIYSLFRFIVGRFEEHGYAENREDLPSQHRIHVASSAERVAAPAQPSSGFFSLALGAYKNLIRFIKSSGRHAICPHPFSCTFYVLQGTVKLFSLGYGLQACLRLLLQLKRVVRRPSILPRLLFHKNAFKLGAFLGGLSGIFRLVSCVLRRVRNKDSKYHAIVAGLLAGLSFVFFPDNTIALYVMWKSLQIIYNNGVERGYLPEVCGFTILLYTISTAILFHAAVLEPHNLRPSYWKFLFSISGGRISTMDRKCMDAFGLESSRGLLEMAGKTKTPLLPISYFE